MPKQRKILVTNALIYANGPPHLGHCVGAIQADIWVRTQKMQGHDCLFICGSDSHGTPIMIQAEKMGIRPEDLIKKTHQQQVQDFKDFQIEFDNYYPTHSQENEELVNIVFNRHVDKKNIGKHTIKQLFDPIKKIFLPDRYIKGECPNCGAKDQYGDNCEECGATYLPTELKNYYSILSGTTPIEKKSEHYFFKLQHYTEFLKNWTTADHHLQKQVINKVEEWFSTGLREWDISRDAPYFGFLIPHEKDKYFYVWLDAPIGYMASFKNLCARRKELIFEDYWDKKSKYELHHFIGKDIIYFHALFWPAILEGSDYRTPSSVRVSGFLTIEGQKMSKSRGTFINARTYLNHLQPEYLRYYFAAKLSERIEDIDLNFDDFTQRVNSDLVGKFVNIASRCASFLNKYFSGKLSANCLDLPLYNEFALAGDRILAHWNDLEYSHAIRDIMALADRANQYIDGKKPWLHIHDDALKKEVQAVATMGINFFRILMIYLKPVLPETAKKAEKFLNISPLQWNDKDNPLLNHSILDFQPLINRIDPKTIEELKMEPRKETENAPTPTAAENVITKQKISLEDFAKVDLRIAKIIKAEFVEGADKLLALHVDLGEETRHVLAGIKLAYKPEELIGRHVIVVANLEPRKMRFGVSEGMVLAAGPGGKDIWLVSPDPGAESGMKVK